jgi:DNA/RNA endonuclease G (NUC1)
MLLLFSLSIGEEEGLRRSRSEPTTKKRSMVYTPTTMNDMSPTLPIRIIRPNPDLEIAFDVRTRIPVYVLEHLRLNRRRSRAAAAARRPNFYEERALPEQYRSRPSHYRGSGFDRGHLAPAADFPDTPEDTFTLCNIAPQDHTINVTIWNRLERWVRRVAEENASSAVGGGETYVVTGPLWLPTRQVDENKYEYSHLGIGRPPSLVHVPTHFFKVVVVVEKNQICQFACFVVENHHSSEQQNKQKKKNLLEDYVVQWTDLETITGLQFFPSWADANWKERADQVTRDSNLAKTVSSQSLLLLADNNNSSSSSQKSRQRRRRQQQSVDTTIVELVHLCMEGKCR